MNALVGRTTRCIILARLRFSWHGNSPHSQPVALVQQACIRIQLHTALPESAALRLEGLHLRSQLLLSQRTSRISLSLKALHSALRAPFAQQLSPSNEKARIRTQPHFALQESAALRPSGSICAAQLLLSRLHLVQQAAFGACSGSMPPGCAASLRYMPLTRYECYGRPHNPVHYCCFSFAFWRVWRWRFAVGLLAQRLDAPSCTASRRYIPL